MENTGMTKRATLPAVDRKLHGVNRTLGLIWRYRMIYLMVLPGIAFFILFKYVPLYGLLLVFKDFKYNLGILGSPWVGMEHFRTLAKDTQFWNVFLNTVIISFGKILTGFPAPIVLALLLNELKSPFFKRITQSVLYLPHFFSWIIISGLAFNLFSSTNGAITKFMSSLNVEMPVLLNDPRTFRGFLYATNVWKTMGWGMIIYLAALAGIDTQLYEAAVVDGCSRLKQTWYITLPCISYTIVVLLILNVGQMMNAGFDQVFNLYSDRVYKVADIIDTYVYRKGLVGAQYEYGTVVGLFKSVIGCALLYTANIISKKITNESPI